MSRDPFAAPGLRREGGRRLPDEFNPPTIGIKGAPQVRRRRVFSDAELATFLKWLPNSPFSLSVRDALTMVLLTGCRSGEVVAGRWRDMDLDRGVWTIRETKNGEPHDVMLPHQAIELLKSRQELDEIFAFPSPRRGRHLAQKALGIAQYAARRRIDGQPAQDPIEVPWTVHDLRRGARALFVISHTTSQHSRFPRAYNFPHDKRCEAIDRFF